jgi:hypothetical protein
MIKKNWIGKYGYSFDEESENFFSFEIFVDFNDGSFQGTVFEEEFSGFTGDSVAIKGFIEEDFISFVKTYPYYYASNENGEMIVDKQMKGHEVVYEGFFNTETGEWNGEWEILMHEEKDKSMIGRYITKSIIGPWKMKLKECL